MAASSPFSTIYGQNDALQLSTGYGVLLASFYVMCTSFYRTWYYPFHTWPGTKLATSATIVVFSSIYYKIGGAVYNASPAFKTAIATSIILYLLHSIYTAIYRIYFHPLSKFPGPKLAAATPLYSAAGILLGKKHKMNVFLHEKYGEVVRVSPNTLSFIGETGWKDVYMFKSKEDGKQMQKVMKARQINGAYNILTAPDEVHKRQRKVLSEAFSERALRDQESILQNYISLLLTNLRTDAKAKVATDVTSELNFLTFDIISDLSFGTSFDALSTRTWHPWMKTFYNSIRNDVRIGTLRRILFLVPILLPLIPPLLKAMIQQFTYVTDRVSERIERGSERPDFMAKISSSVSSDGTALSRAEMDVMFNLLALAGSETTATALSGCVFLLCQNPQALGLLREEVRDAFERSEEITIVKVNKFPYLLAVLQEVLRVYPPAPCAFNRRTLPEGASICGYWVPGGVAVGVAQHAAYHSPTNFARPDEFIPERFLPSHEAEFAGDRKGVFQPFSAGPRNCVGRNLAYAEMKLTLARIIFEFDFELVDKNEEWIENQKVYQLWDKSPLMVRFVEREKINHDRM